ncbi:MAG: UbiX family flavin prenyltransferase [Caldilineales bacterium]|nr:UbiX family flavin prenyltransferase [Caldilineales bacterium]MDW8317846.1 UbiX family flavin prenyltransferase [Anaerolineae bacterium]
MSPSPRRLIVALSGASGQIYGIRLLQVLRAAREQAPPDQAIETHLVMSEAAGITITQETDYTPRQVEAMADVVYRPRDVGAAIASGSFPVMGMVVAPCSIKTLSAIAHSYSADLISRAADVQLKEGRPLLLLLRETPLHLGHIRLMAQAAEAGAVIMPPVPAFYSRPQTVQDIVDGTVGRVLARLGIENELYYRWLGVRPAPPLA